MAAEDNINPVQFSKFDPASESYQGTVFDNASEYKTPGARTQAHAYFRAALSGTTDTTHPAHAMPSGSHEEFKIPWLSHSTNN
jgi:hypothetical protein